MVIIFKTQLWSGEQPMETLQFTIDINAPQETVWNTMLGDETSREWLEVFAPGSHFVGDWSEGSQLLFLAPDERGEMEGMVSRIRETRPPELISIEYIGVIEDGVEDTSSAAAKEWADAGETYTFTVVGSKTQVEVEMMTPEEDKEWFQTTWPKALHKIKELAER